MAERACGAVYRVASEGGPARTCVRYPEHDGDHEDARAIDESRCAFWARAVKAEHKLTVLRARVAELEAGLTPHTAETWAAMLDGVRREGAEAMRERAAAVLDERAALDAERVAEDVRVGDETGAKFWRARVIYAERAARKIRALPLDAAAGEEVNDG